MSKLTGYVRYTEYLDNEVAQGNRPTLQPMDTDKVYKMLLSGSKVVHGTTSEVRTTTCEFVVANLQIVSPLELPLLWCKVEVLTGKMIK